MSQVQINEFKAGCYAVSSDRKGLTFELGFVVVSNSEELKINITGESEIK